MPEHLDAFHRNYAAERAKVGIATDREAAVKTAVGYMDHHLIRQLLVDMNWNVHPLPEHAEGLLACDRPLIMLSGLGSLADPESFIIMPISPRAFFSATFNAATTTRISSMPPDQRVLATNQWVTQRARRFVYGLNDEKLEFVTENFGLKPQKSLFDLVPEYRQ